MSNDDPTAQPELPTGEGGAVEPGVSAARVALLLLLLLPALAFGVWLYSLAHPVAGTAGQRMAERLAFVPVGIAVGVIVAIEGAKKRVRPTRHPAFFGAVLGGGPRDAEADPALRTGALGRNEPAVLQFTARLKMLSGEQWSAVLYPVKSLRQAWMADARRSRAYHRAKEALQATEGSGEAEAALAALLRAEFRQVNGTTDLNAPSNAYAAALAVLLRDTISPADFRSLYAPFEPVIPPQELWKATTSALR